MRELRAYKSAWYGECCIERADICCLALLWELHVKCFAQWEILSCVDIKHLKFRMQA